MNRRPHESSVEAATWVDLLRWRARQQPDRQAYTYLIDGEAEGVSLTYAELDRQARAIGAWLQQQGASGERALLLYPSGLEFIAAFFGCLYSGVIAVPAYPPTPTKPDRSMLRIRAIAIDAHASVVLTTSAILSKVEQLCAQAPELRAVHWLATDSIVGDPSTGSGQALAAEWRDPSVNGDTLAFLQYTSGSTASPKGVMVSHRNLMYNSALIHRRFGHTSASRFVSWLPLYHDMGLIGGMLQPLYGGFPSLLMSPAAFLQRPFRWLQAISCTRATTSGAPNFAYDLCVRKITQEQRAALDLSSWDVAFNGAEPIRHETLERFAATFAPCGFRREALYPCYGLAEATLMVSGGLKSALPIIHTVRKDALEHNRVAPSSIEEDESARVLVGCGQSLQDQKIAIVDPESLTPCLPDRVGEIWVSGPSVAQGYWNRPAETAHTFKAYLANTGEGPFLRTGDLGFMENGELFITGRLKDLIIIRGTNHYPQDIELTVEQSHPALRPNSCAAFSIEVAGEEGLVIVQEVDRRCRNLNVDEVVLAVRRAVIDQHELEAHAVALVHPGSIPKTSSGKIQRAGCRAGFLARRLNVLGEWTLNPEGRRCRSSPEADGPIDQAEVKENSRTPQAIQTWLRSQIFGEQVSSDLDLMWLGLDSIKVMELIASFERDFRLRVHPREFFERRSIEELATYLAAELGRIPQIQAYDLTETGRPLATIFTSEVPGPQDRHEARRGQRRTKRNPGIIFLLSSPRSGSTLLRVMLAGHPQLFCPPELHLLPFQNLRDRREALRLSYLEEGLQRAFMELMGLDAARSKRLLDGLIEQEISIPQVYGMLQQFAGTRVLVDKSPSYAATLETLERAEELFEEPKYIHLVRHPYAVIESFVRNRFDRLLGANDADPVLFAEQIWATTNGNLLDFLQQVDPKRHRLVRFEALVSEPATAMRSLCEFLGVPFDGAVLRPYEGNRMTDGVHATSRGVGDPGFLQHDRIDPTLGEVWREIRLPRRLGEVARRVAAELGYELLQERSAPAVDRLHEGPQPPPILAVAREGNPLVAFTSSVIVPIQPAGSKPPFFCVAPAGGVVYPYYGLVHHLGEDQPLYALRDPSLAGECEPYSQIEDYAAHYLRAMRDVQPEGPYLLGGWSFGGLVAFELALQLQRQGQQVALLVVIDTEARAARKRRSFKESLSSYKSQLLGAFPAVCHLVPIVLDGAYLAALHLKRRKEHAAQPLSVKEYARLIWLEALRRSFLKQANMADVLSRDPGLLQIGLATTSLRRVIRNLTSNARTASRYAPKQVCLGKITLFRASERILLRGRSKDPTLGWSGHAAGGVEVHDIPGNHMVLFRRPFVEALAGELRVCIERAQADITNGDHGRIGSLARMGEPCMKA